MKPLWVAVSLFFLLLLLLGFEANWLDSTTKPLAQDIRQAAQAAEVQDWPQAEALTHQVQDRWKTQVPILLLLKTHRDIQEISLLLEESLVLLESQSWDDYAVVSLQLRHALEGLGEIEQLCWGNLF